VILIGGRYFGSKYFRLSKKDSINFLAFATVFAVLYLTILQFTEGIYKNQVVNLFITYLVVTSFYELIAQWFFEFIESKIPWFKKKETPAKEAIEKYEDATGEKVIGKSKE
jgi:hypothetical protein